MEMSSACGSWEGRVGSMKLARLFCGTVAALRYRVHYRNDVRMEQKRRADAGRRCLGLLAQCSYSPFHKTTAQSQGAVGGDLDPSFIRTSSEQRPSSKNFPSLHVVIKEMQPLPTQINSTDAQCTALRDLMTVIRNINLHKYNKNLDIKLQNCKHYK